VAVEFGRKTIPSRDRPTIDTVENETIAGPAPVVDAAAVKEAA
jgi:chemotaxis protein MotA